MIERVPYKAKKACAVSGCANLTSDRYCEFHAKTEMQKYNKYKRDAGSNKRYGRNWKKIRAAFLSQNPVCSMCAADNKIVPAVIAHHILPTAEGGANDYGNLTGLCKPCHERIHAERGDRF